MPITAKPYLKSISTRFEDGLDLSAYPYCIPAVRGLDRLDFHPDVTFFVGENGAGKSTVLEAIALALGYAPEGGTRNVRLSTTESVSPLHHALRLSHGFKKPSDGYFLRAESFFNLATYMDDIDLEGGDSGYGGKSLHARSHGEAFMSLFTHKLRGKGLYLMDEPEAALSPMRQMAALSAMHQLVEADSQFIIATHSPILLAYPRAKILLFGGTGITETAYEDTEHYRVTRDFLNHHPRRVAQLMADD